MKENGFEYVDLGLESGTMWATCNVGHKSKTIWKNLKKKDIQ